MEINHYETTVQLQTTVQFKPILSFGQEQFLFVNERSQLPLPTPIAHDEVLQLADDFIAKGGADVKLKLSTQIGYERKWPVAIYSTSRWRLLLVAIKKWSKFK
jgi:hypothetical protein